MMFIRKAVLALAVTSAAALAGPLAANAATSAATHATSLTAIPVTGMAHNGKRFTGKMTVTRFATRAGHTVALGVLTGRLGARSIKPTTVAMPVSVKQTPQGVASTAAVCQVLNLVLGPLHLNLLGLHVDLNKVILNITGHTGAGQLLGNLVCGIANLLNTQPVLGSQLSGLLNIVQQLTNNSGLLGL